MIKDFKDYNTYIFDLDGTLINSEKDIISGANFTLNSLGFSSKTDTEIIAHVGLGLIHLLRNILPKNHTNEILQKAYELQKTYYETKKTLSIPYENVLNLLNLLKNNNKNIFVVTNKTHKATITILKSLELIDYFNDIYGADSLKEKKPSPFPINYISKKFQIEKEDILFIGDSITDYKTSVAAKVDFILITHGFETQENINLIDSYKIDSFNEIISFIK